MKFSCCSGVLIRCVVSGNCYRKSLLSISTGNARNFRLPFQADSTFAPDPLGDYNSSQEFLDANVPRSRQSIELYKDPFVKGYHELMQWCSCAVFVGFE